MGQSGDPPFHSSSQACSVRLSCATSYPWARLLEFGPPSHLPTPYTLPSYRLAQRVLRKTRHQLPARIKMSIPGSPSKELMIIATFDRSTPKEGQPSSWISNERDGLDCSCLGSNIFSSDTPGSRFRSKPTDSCLGRLHDGCPLHRNHADDHFDAPCTIFAREDMVE